MAERKIAFITGSRRGIGRAIAFALAEAGFATVINDITQDADVELTMQGLEDRGSPGKFILGDIADLANHERLLDEIYNEFGRIDCLVNNAGVQLAQRGDILDLSPEEFDRLVDVNLRGTFFLTQAVARRMARDSPNRAGRSIVTITSANSVMVSPEKSAYCISKAGLSMATQLFAVRLAEYGIPVFEIRPGLIATEMTLPVRERYGPMIEEGLSPIRRWGKPEDVANAVKSLVTGALPFTVGQPINVDGGLLVFRL